VPPLFEAGPVCFICMTTCHVGVLIGKLLGSRIEKSVTRRWPSL
jgi:hypothetical protein